VARGGAAPECVGQIGNPTAPLPAARGNTGTPAGTAPTGNPWQVSGYQFDLDSANVYTGQLYEGQGRGIVNPPGGMVLLLPGNCAARIGTVAADPTVAIKPHRGLDGEWQQIQVIARGNTLVHLINGQVIAVTIDDNTAARAPQGVLSLQLEGSGQIWYRNIHVKPLDRPMEFPR
jgi:hypothetical protein